MSSRDPYLSGTPRGASTPTGGTSGGGDEGKGTTGQAVEQVKDKAGQAADQAKEKAGELKEQAKEQATSRLEGQKGVAVEGLRTLAQAVRQTGQQLREQDKAGFAQYADSTADQIERFSGYLRERDVNQLISETESFARRQGPLFLAGAFALGLLGGRFLKSSGRRAQEMSAPADSLDTPPYGTQAAGPVGVPPATPSVTPAATGVTMPPASVTGRGAGMTGGGSPGAASSQAERLPPPPTEPTPPSGPPRSTGSAGSEKK